MSSNNAFPKEELYSLDYTIAKFLLPRLAGLQNMLVQHMNEIELVEDIGTMIEAFEDVISSIDNTEVWKESTADGLRLFAHRFGDLWY